MIRNILATILGLISAVLFFMLAEGINKMIYPLPTTVNSEQALNDYIYSRAFDYWILVLLGWIIGSFLAGYIQGRIASTTKKVFAITLGSLLTLSSILNFYLISHPIWIVCIAIPIFIPMVLLGFNRTKSIKLK